MAAMKHSLRRTLVRLVMLLSTATFVQFCVENEDNVEREGAYISVLYAIMRYLVVIALLFSFGSPASCQTVIQLVLKNGTEHKIEKVDAFDLSQKEIYDQPYLDTLVFTFKKTNIDCYN